MTRPRPGLDHEHFTSHFTSHNNRRSCDRWPPDAVPDRHHARRGHRRASAAICSCSRSASSRCRWRPRSTGCWARTSSPMWTCQASIAPTSTVLRCWPQTRSAPRKKHRERVQRNAEVLTPGVVPANIVRSGEATVIATGAMLPRGADAVVMVEHTDVVDANGTVSVEVSRAVAQGDNVSFAGTDIARGETVLRAGQVLTLARDRRAGSYRCGRGARVPSPARGDPVHRRRDRAARVAAAAGRDLRFERGDRRCGGDRTRAASRSRSA